MKTLVLLASVSAIAFSHCAFAEGPSHVKITQCSPTVRQNITAVVGHPITVVFPQGENAWLAPMSGKVDPVKGVEPQIEGVKPEDIQKMPNKNVMTLWPDAAAVTTMTAIMQLPDGSLKTYPFLINAIADGQGVLDREDITLNLICTNHPVGAVRPVPAPIAAPSGPAPVVHAAAAVRRQVLTAGQKAEAEERLRTEAFNGDDGVCHYHAKGRSLASISPMCPMDNGQWTLIRFKGLTRKPAIYVGSCEDGNDQERLARQHETGDFVVIEEIAPRFCLRLGSNPSDVLEVINDHYDPVGNSPDTGTTSPAVRRELIQAKSR